MTAWEVGDEGDKLGKGDKRTSKGLVGLHTKLFDDDDILDKEIVLQKVWRQELCHKTTRNYLLESSRKNKMGKGCCCRDIVK